MTTPKGKRKKAGTGDTKLRGLQLARLVLVDRLRRTDSWVPAGALAGAIRDLESAIRTERQRSKEAKR